VVQLGAAEASREYAAASDRLVRVDLGRDAEKVSAVEGKADLGVTGGGDLVVAAGPVDVQLWLGDDHGTGRRLAVLVGLVLRGDGSPS